MWAFSHVYKPTAEDDCDMCGKAHESATVEDYSQHTSYTEKGERTVNSYSD
jgi:hypothetical protein